MHFGKTALKIATAAGLEYLGPPWVLTLVIVTFCLIEDAQSMSRARSCLRGELHQVGKTEHRRQCYASGTKLGTNKEGLLA